MDALTERVLDLEVKLAYQDHLLAELNQLVKQTADAVVFLRAEVRQLQEGVGVSAAKPTSERPPHY